MKLPRCGPCVAISPFLEELAAKYPEVTFIKVDVDEASEIAAERGIEAMPTFHYYKNGQKVDELVGASKTELESKITKHKVVIPMKNPSEMTIKELKNAIINAGLGTKAVGLIEKQEFIDLLNNHLNK